MKRKPCPFCGENSVHSEIAECGTVGFVYCMGCRGRGPDADPDEPDFEELIWEKWNQREGE